MASAAQPLVSQDKMKRARQGAKNITFAIECVAHQDSMSAAGAAEGSQWQAKRTCLRGSQGTPQDSMSATGAAEGSQWQARKRAATGTVPI